MCPRNPSYYGNRAATLMMLCRYREALEDAQQAVRLDGNFVKVGVAPPEFDESPKWSLDLADTKVFNVSLFPKMLSEERNKTQKTLKKNSVFAQRIINKNTNKELQEVKLAHVNLSCSFNIELAE